DADQIELGKMVSLGNELRTDDEIKTTRCYVVELPSQTLDRFHKVAREHQNAGLRKQLRCLLLKPFDAWPDGCKAFGGMAIRAFRRWRDGIPTVVTHQPSLEPIMDQPSVAIRTLHTESAGTTQRSRCVTAAIEKQQCLFATGQRNGYDLGKAGRDETSAERALAAHIDCLD